MWREYSEAVLFHAGSLSPKQLAFITNGFARALVPDRDVFRRLADRAIEKASDFEPRDVALLLNGYARLQFRDLVLFEHFSKEICSRPADGYGEQQLSLVANAYARLDISDRKLFQRLGGWIAARSPELTPQGLATVMNAYAKMQIRDTKLFEALATSVRRLLPELSPQHLANVLNAYAKLQIQDTEVLEVVVSQVPRTIQGFGPIEVAATLHAITALEIGQPALTQALTALASAVQERAEGFRARQFAGVLHAFSTLNTTYGRMLADLAPHVVQCLSDADDQSLSVMFCAYARAGQPVEHVIAPLLERLEPLVATVEPQGLVQLFYACGRLGLHREKLVRRLAQLLQRDVTALSPQHVANCAYAVARLGLETEECAALLGSLQVQLARGSLSFEPQHCVNILHALAAVHGVGSPTQDVAVPLAGTVVPAIVKQALALDWRGPKHAQLLASATVSCARLREASAQLFSLAARTVQLAGTGAPISRQGLADLLGAFTATRFFDLDLFAWVLSRFSLDRPDAVQIPAILGVVGALDHASHSFVDSEDLAALGRLPVAGADGAVPAEAGAAVLFADCPPHFRLQAGRFMEGAGLALLAAAEKMPGEVLLEAAVPFARAGLLSTAPFDLLGPVARHRAVAAAAMPPPVPLGAAGLAPEGSEDASAWPGPPVAAETALDLLLLELGRPDAAGAAPAALVRRLAKYAAWLPAPGGEGGDGLAGPALPAAVLDPLLRRMAEHLVARASALSFADAASALATLAGSGSAPRAVVEALSGAAEARFPAPPCPGAGEDPQLRETIAAVAELSRSAGGPSGGGQLGDGLAARLADFAGGYVQAIAGATTRRPSAAERLLHLRAVSCFVPQLRRCGALTPELLGGLLAVVLSQVLLPQMAVAGGAPSADAAGPTDLVELLAALMPLAAALPPTGAGASAVDGIDEALHDACAVGALLLSEALRPAEVPPGELLGVLELLGTAPGARGGACHLELLATLTECVAARAQALGPAGVASCLHAVARSRALASLGSSRAAAGSTAAEAAAAACRRARAFCGMPEEPATAPGPGAGPGAPSRLPPAASELLRALLLWDRRLSAAEAARGAHFCALALDCPAFGEEERGQARAGLSQLLRRLSWERRRWSPEDRGLIASVGALLRSEFPELLRPPFAGRSVLAMLEELRGERTVTAAANAPIGRST